MSLSIGAASNALSYLQSLIAQGTAGIGDAASTGGPLTALFQSLSGSSASSQPAATAAGNTQPASSFDTGTMAALLSLQGQSASGTTAQSLFAKIDSNGDGQISKSEFEDALGSDGVGTSTADTIFSQLDTNGDGSISESELTSAKSARGHHHHHAHGGGAAHGGGQSASSSSSSSSSADGTTTQTTTNPDGSTTTTVTYADGSSVVTTTPVAAQQGTGTPSGTNGQNNSNLAQQLIQLQAQLVSVASSTLSSFV